MIFLAAVEQYRKAMVDADGAVLTTVTSDQLSYGHSDATVENKAEFILSITCCQSIFVTLALTCLYIQFMGNTAMLRHTFFANTNDGGIPRTVNLHILWVWQQSNGKSQLLARQAVRIPV